MVNARRIPIFAVLGAVVLSVGLLLMGSARPESVSACDSFSSWSGTVNGGQEAVHTAEFCSDPNTDLLVALNWGDAKKDLRLVVTDPNGAVFVVDGHSPQPYEVYARAAPLPEGKWTFAVEYNGKGKVKYSLWSRFE